MIDYGRLLLYNPTTQTYNELPILHVWRPSKLYPCFNFGFGYDGVSKDYKCVRVMQLLNKETGFLVREVMVYSMKTNCWRRVYDLPCYFNCRNRDIGALVHGDYHWVGTNSDDVYKGIVAFNLRDETFFCLSLPKFHFEKYDDLYVGMLDGCLCLFANRYLHCNLWVMKEYGVAGSWAKMFTVGKRQRDNLERPISYSMNHRRLFVAKSLYKKLGYIDLETMETTNVTFADWGGGLDAHVYVENLLMLDYAESADGSRFKTERHRKRKNKQTRSRMRN